MTRLLNLLCSSLVLSFLTAPAGLSAAEGRARIDLNGTWRRAVTTDPAETAPPADAEWADFTVPGTAWLTPVGGSHYLWLRRNVALPEAWSGQRVFVDLRGARYAPRLYIDGHLAGARLDGLSPFLVEVTDWVRPGATHRLELRCQDRGAGFPDGFALAPGADDDAIRGKVLLPVGGYKENTGPWDDVWLESRPVACLDDEALVIAPSVRRHDLTITGSVSKGTPGMRVGAVVLDGDREVLSLGPASVEADGTWALVAPFADARCWSPEDPHLYLLRIALLPAGDDALLDRVDTRFGFKEVWTAGPDIILNGVKRHLLASSTWPIMEHETPEAVRAKVRAIRAQGCNTFRLHIGPWQEEWLRAADEIGLMIVVESALYTDGSGFYAYADERFWANCRDHIAGMIGRDRNHASVVMWSLCNEILFMGNQRYDASLPGKLGELGRYAKGIDPHHPITFEADRDPDGAADVIGLHYPHELPGNHDYPNTCDWLGGRITAEAGGGMLGQAGGDFFWNRRKPLYIGEYLWVPSGDFSVGSIFFGDDAYRNRDAYHLRAQTAAFHDQTLAYRRSGVSGMCPWSVYGFGGAAGAPERVAVQEHYYRPVAAFLRNRGLRAWANEPVILHFDVFNDGDRPLSLELQVRDAVGTVLATESLNLDPGGYGDAGLVVTAPDSVAASAAWPLTSLLLADGAERSRDVHPFRVFRRAALLTLPAGVRLITCDRGGVWRKAVAALDNPDRAVLILPGGILTPTVEKNPDNLPRVGALDFDGEAFLGFLNRGGRALVCEQHNLSALGLDLTTVDHRSTMTFPLRSSHRLFEGLEPGDLSFWREDNVVAQRQIRRPVSGGARALVVSGGPDSLGQGTVVEMPVGRGRVLVVQALAWGCRETDPAAAMLLDNGLTWIAELPPPATGKAMVGTADVDFASALRELGVACDEGPVDLAADVPDTAAWLLLSGTLTDAAPAAAALRRHLERGGNVYWHAPDPAAFASVRGALGADGLRVAGQATAASLLDREAPLLDGISREDVTYTTGTKGWDRTMDLLTTATRTVLLPEVAGRNAALTTRLVLADAKLAGGSLGTVGGAPAIVFAKRGSAEWAVPVAESATRLLRVRASGVPKGDTWPRVMVEVNGDVATGFTLSRSEPADTLLPVPLKAGANTLRLRFINGSEWGGGCTLDLTAVEVAGAVRFPVGAQVLVAPASVVTWPVGRGRVVVDGLDWTCQGPNAIRGRRWANALLANLGVLFEAPASRPAFESVSMAAFALVDESPYSDLKPDRIALRAAGAVSARFRCVTPGRYRLRLDGSASPCQGVYAVVRIEIDGTTVGDTELASSDDRSFDAGSVDLSAGPHTATLTFTNDATANGEDRNLFLRGFALARESEGPDR